MSADYRPSYKVSQVWPVPAADGMRNWALVHRGGTGRKSLITLDTVTSIQPKQGPGTCASGMVMPFFLVVACSLSRCEAVLLSVQ